MSKLTVDISCPNCEVPIPVYLVDIDKDLAECTVCDTVFKASELIEKAKAERRAPGSLELPKGSKIRIDHVGHTTIICLPTARPDIGYSYTLLFLTLWLGIGVYMTYIDHIDTVLSYIWGTIVLLPGVYFWYSTLKWMYKKELISIEPKQIVFTDKFLFSDSESFTWKELYGFGMERYKYEKNLHRRHSIPIPMESSEYPDHGYPYRVTVRPVIRSSKGTFYFFLGATDVEKGWVVDYLGHELSKH